MRKIVALSVAMFAAGAVSMGIVRAEDDWDKCDRQVENYKREVAKCLKQAKTLEDTEGCEEH